MSSTQNLYAQQHPIIMGIVNITPDSFFDGGQFTNSKHILSHIEKMISDGAGIIDVGAYSSRPGAAFVDETEEFNRLNSIVSLIKTSFPNISLSIDSFRSSVIQKIHDTIGTFIVNDISGGNIDKEMMKTCGKLQLPYICMHMKGTPQTMQQFTTYTNLIEEIKSYFSHKIEQADKYNIPEIIIDPGFGFSKTREQNYHLLAHLDEFQSLQKPVLVGLSRKSMIYNTLHTTPQQALNGTSILNTIAVEKHASILRVHDVKEARECIVLTQELLKQK
ncbi:MAG: dihydropteroate synthase [Bacteroidales bacterium]